jgi:hypothetical protein
MAEQVEAVEAGKLLFDRLLIERLLIEHSSVLAVRDVRTIGTPICRGNRQSLIANSAYHSTIGS